jgi:hypothetical protein
MGAILEGSLAQGVSQCCTDRELMLSTVFKLRKTLHFMCVPMMRRSSMICNQ